MRDILKESGYKVGSDGDVVRTNLSKGLGFSKEDRDNIKRIGFVCHLLSRKMSLPSPGHLPYRDVRTASGSRSAISSRCTPCPLEVLVERDVTGCIRRRCRWDLELYRLRSTRSR